MIPDFAQQVLNDSSFYQDALILLVAIVLAKAAPLPREAQALVWFSHLAKQLAQKLIILSALLSNNPLQALWRCC